MVYCPKCFGDNLHLAKHGVVHVSINKKQMQSGQFLFNIMKDSKKEIKQKIQDKIEEFMKWYSSFQNKEPIRSVQLASSDFICENGCPVNIANRYSVINVLIAQDELVSILEETANKYNIRLMLDLD